MSGLLELQRAMAGAILADAPAPEHRLRHPRINPVAAFAVHRRHFMTSLREALAATFPAVVRLVGEGFFAHAAHEFVGRYPPISPCLADYGHNFPPFLAGFEPCAHLAYLADCARLEWLLHEAGTAPVVPPLDRDALTRVLCDAVAALGLRLDPTLRFLAAEWPVDSIVEIARTEGDAAGLTLDRCDLFLQIRRLGRQGRSMRLTEATFAFRAALADGVPLERAFDQACAVDRGFDLAKALANLIDEGAVIGLVTEPTTKEQS